MRLGLAAAVGLALAVAACASPAERISNLLESRGVPQRQARCMGQRLADRLDSQQLARLNELSKLNRERAGRMSLDTLLDQLHQDGDPKLVAVLVKAGLHCAI